MDRTIRRSRLAPREARPTRCRLGVSVAFSYPDPVSGNGLSWRETAAGSPARDFARNGDSPRVRATSAMPPGWDRRRGRGTARAMRLRGQAATSCGRRAKRAERPSAPDRRAPDRPEPASPGKQSRPRTAGASRGVRIGRADQRASPTMRGPLRSCCARMARRGRANLGGPKRRATAGPVRGSEPGARFRAFGVGDPGRGQVAGSVIGPRAPGHGFGAGSDPAPRFVRGSTDRPTTVRTGAKASTAGSRRRPSSRGSQPVGARARRGHRASRRAGPGAAPAP